MYVHKYTYTNMKPNARAAAGRKKQARAKKIGRLRASAEETWRPLSALPEWPGHFRAIKKPVTLRLDADVLAWFRRDGRGYQTRINRALRKVMTAEKKSDASQQ
jgi:uncharacterized protein (DUF4415 family)